MSPSQVFLWALVVTVASSAAGQHEGFDLYRLEGDDVDSVLSMADLDMFREMHSAENDRHDDDQNYPDFSRVDDEPLLEDDEQVLLKVVASRSTSDEGGIKKETPVKVMEQEQEEWHEPENKMDLVRLFNGLYYQHQYGKINERLVSKLPSAHVAENLAEVGAWLERERTAGVSMFANKALHDALEQLYALARVPDEGVRCSRHAYAILWKNDRATEGKAHRPPSRMSPPRRVEALVHQVCLSHAIECLPEYPRKYAQIRASLDASQRELVETGLNNVLGSVDNTRSRIRSLAAHGDAARHVYDLIERHSHHDPDRRYLVKVVDERRGRMAVDRQKVGELVERYLVAPCRHFVRALGPDVFIPARFDATSLEKEDRYQPDSRELVEFLHGWLHYRLCDSLVRRDAPALTKQVAAVAEQLSPPA